MGTSDDGTIRGGGIWWWVGILYLVASTKIDEYNIGNPTMISTKVGITLCHGRDAGVGGLVDGPFWIGR